MQKCRFPWCGEPAVCFNSAGYLDEPCGLATNPRIRFAQLFPSPSTLPRSSIVRIRMLLGNHGRGAAVPKRVGVLGNAVWSRITSVWVYHTHTHTRTKREKETETNKIETPCRPGLAGELLAFAGATMRTSPIVPLSQCRHFARLYYVPFFLVFLVCAYLWVSSLTFIYLFPPPPRLPRGFLVRCVSARGAQGRRGGRDLRWIKPFREFDHGVGFRRLIVASRTQQP